MEKIRDYFNNISKKMTLESDISGGGSHRGDIGTNREVVFQSFLNNHIPNSLRAHLGGEIVGLDGKSSGQLDIIIASDIAARFAEKEKTFFIVEGVAGVVSVKSFLDKAQLHDALGNLSSIPDFSSDVLSFDPIASANKDRFCLWHPSLFILAYDGLSVETIKSHIDDYYADNPHINKNRYPTNVIVNGKYQINYVKKETKSEYGKIIPSDTFYAHKIKEAWEGFPFVHLLANLNQYVQWLPHMKIDMDKYYNKAYGFEK